jgi:hypothetical protein
MTENGKTESGMAIRGKNLRKEGKYNMMENHWGLTGINEE